MERELDEQLKKILDFVIPNRKIESSRLEEWKRIKDWKEENGPFQLTIGDVIDASRSLWRDRQTGVYVFNHGGILQLQEAIGAYWSEPRLDAQPNANNERGFYYSFMCHFADGSSFPASGEATDLNTEKGKQSYMFKQNQAYIRGMSKSLIRGVGLYGIVYSEDEADAFESKRISDLREQYERKIGEMRANLEEQERNAKAREVRLLKLIENVQEYVAIPGEGQEPSQFIHALYQNKEFDTLEAIKQGENHIIAFVANQYLKMHETEKRKTDAEQAKNIKKEEQLETKKLEAETGPELAEQQKEEEAIPRASVKAESSVEDIASRKRMKEAKSAAKREKKMQSDVKEKVSEKEDESESLIQKLQQLDQEIN